MSDKKTILHKRSKVIDALTHKPAIPKGSGLKIGEIAMHFKEGYERLYIKNDQGNIATFKADDGFNEGNNIVNGLDGLPTDKRSVLAQVPRSTQELTLAQPLEDGKHMHIVAEAESGTIVKFPYESGNYKIVNDDYLFKINEGEIGDIDISAMDGKMYLSTHIAPYRSWFIGESENSEPFGCKINGSATTTNVESGEVVRLTEFLTSAKDMFYCRNTITSLDLSNFDTLEVTDMNSMFGECHKLASVDLSNISTTRVNNMSYMFYNCYELTSADLSYFRTPQLETMSRMFCNCKALDTIDISNVDTSKVTDMHDMFSGCVALTALDVRHFDTANVTDMHGMFFSCKSVANLDVSKFNTSKVTDMISMFSGCAAVETLDVYGFNTSEVTSMDSMFDNCWKLTNLDVRNFNTSRVTSMNRMFNACRALTSLNLSNFDTTNVESMQSMFGACYELRYITLGANFFKTVQSIPFGDASNLGLNEDGTDNGWLEHLATVAPTITDGLARVIELPTNIKNQSWAAPSITELQDKGYTIA